MGLLEKYDNFIFDMDGVIYIEDRPISGARELFQKLKGSGKDYVFMTNNSRYSVQGYIRRLKSMGIEAEPDQIISSARVTADYVRDTFGKEKVTTYVIGSKAFKAEMEQAGSKVLSGEEGKKADLVIVGLDVNFSYRKLRIATLAIRNGAAFVGANADPTFPGTEGVYPGAGSLIAALEASTGQKATSIGKPARPMLDAALRYFGNNGERTLIVGDRLDTDILMGNLFGVDTALVLTGINARKDVESSSAKPTYILDGIWSLLQVEGPGPMAEGVPYQEEIVETNVRELFRWGKSNIWVTTKGKVVEILKDDLEGKRHQRFIVETRDGLTLLILRNLDPYGRVPVRIGDSVVVHGEYEWNDKGGIVHKVHGEPNGLEGEGWIFIERTGKRYCRGR